MIEQRRDVEIELARTGCHVSPLHADFAAALAAGAGGVPAGAGAVGRFIVTRIENSYRRRCSLLAVVMLIALISTNSGRSSHLELYWALRKNSDTRSLVCATPAKVTTPPFCLIAVR